VEIGIAVALILAGIHAYLGFHVVSRGVIFVDLSLAQAAAFGYVVAIFVGVGEHSYLSYLIALAFTMLGALLVSIARDRNNLIPHEAFIGIIYAGFAALAVIFMAHLAEGAEIVSEITNGSLLSCSIQELLFVSGLYTAVGLFHYVYRDKFFLISESREKAIQSGVNVLLWDFLFYASFGLVVTSSVHLAGVLMVFSLLVIPPVIALLFTTSHGRRVAFGWVVAGVGAVLGILGSLSFDLPTAPSIMVALILLLILAALVRTITGWGLVSKAG
jgi:zinc/manganese transport system permease protein